jgi:hypothetical protein
MSDNFYRHWFAFVIIVALGGCATTGEQEQTGFISDYSKLERAADNQWRYTNPKIGEYEKFFIEPVAILYERSEDPEFSLDEIEQLKTHMLVSLTKSLTEDDGYEVVSEPGPGVATFRIGFTEVDASIGALNITLYTKITGAGLGGIAAEGEVIDSMTGEQLAAAIRWGSGSRVLRAGFTKLGDAKIVIDRWSREMRNRVDEAHARTR